MRIVHFANESSRCSWRMAIVVAFGGLLMFAAGVVRRSPPPAEATDRLSGDPCESALAPIEGAEALEARIQKLQGDIRTSRGTDAQFERLGWLFVEKARATSNDEYYSLAEKSAGCLLRRNPANSAAKLLRGHALHNAHRFREAEKVAHELVRERESPFDYGLLGDVLMEQGRLEEAAEAYQKMADLKPGMQSYARAAHLRWLFGDLDGAASLMQLAAQASPPRAPEPSAWCLTRLGLYRLQAGDIEGAADTVSAALQFQPEYAPALFAEARVRLAQSNTKNALAAASRAAELNATPEHLWLLADLLHEEGRTEKARMVEEELAKTGIRKDPRTLALYLATRGQRTDSAVEIATLELKSRRDVFTYDAQAWALHAAGRTFEAWPAMESALAAGTQDARLFLHAGLIAQATGRTAQAAEWLEKSHAIRRMLFPSERNLLPEEQGRLVAAVP